MTKSMALFVLVFVVCWTPFFLYTLVLQICQFMEKKKKKKFYLENLKIFYFCLLCGFTKSHINPFLYYWRNKNIRLGIQSFIVNKLRRKNRNVVDVSLRKMKSSTPTTHVKYREKGSIKNDSKISSGTAIKKMKLQLLC